MKQSVIICEQIIDEQLEPYLKLMGFSRKQDMFYKSDGDCLWRLAPSIRKDIRQDQAWLELIACVGFFSLARFLKPCLAKAIFRYIDLKAPCAMATNMGYVMPGQNFIDWHVTPDSTAKSVGIAILEAIEKFGLAYFEQYGSLEKALSAWERGISYNLSASVDFYIAATYWLRNQQERALSFVRARIDYFTKKYEDEHLSSDRERVVERRAFLEWLESRGRIEGSMKTLQE